MQKKMISFMLAVHQILFMTREGHDLRAKICDWNARWTWDAFWATRRRTLSTERITMQWLKVTNFVQKSANKWFSKLQFLKLLGPRSNWYKKTFIWRSVLDRRLNFYGRSRRFRTYGYGYGGRSFLPFLRPKVYIGIFPRFFQNGGWNLFFITHVPPQINVDYDSIIPQN